MRVILVLFAIAACGGSPPPPPKPVNPPKTAKNTPPPVPAALVPAPRQTHDPDPLEALPEQPKQPLDASCDAYLGAMDKLATCEAIPAESRDAIKQAEEQTRVALQQYMSQPGMAETLAQACKQGLDSLTEYAATNGCN